MHATWMFHVDHIFVCFFFNDTATTEIYTLSLHDALPIFPDRGLCLAGLLLPGGSPRVARIGTDGGGLFTVEHCEIGADLSRRAAGAGFPHQRGGAAAEGRPVVRDAVPAADRAAGALQPLVHGHERSAP